METETAAHFDTGSVGAIAAAHSIHDTYSAFLPPLLPVFVERLALSRAGAGLLTVFLQGPSIAQPWLGRLGDRVDPRPFVILTPAVTAVAMSLLGVAPGYAWLALLLSIAGCSSAALHAVGPALAGRRSGVAVGRAMGFWMVGGEAGRAMGPLVVASGIRLLGLKGTPWLMLGGLLASAMLFGRLRKIPWRRDLERHAPELHGARLSTLLPVMLPMAGLLTARAFILAVITTYLPLFLREAGGSLWASGAALTVVEVAGVAGALLGGAASDRWGRRRLIGGSMALTPLLVVVFVFGSTAVRLALLAPMGFVGLSVAPSLMAAVQDAFPADRGLANGIYQAMSFMVRSVVVVAAGAMADHLGIRTAFLICASLAFASLPLVLALPRRHEAG
ncbi:MAG: MFS transporter [Acidobacteria bacterium]|nr:MFS transporter [Acidobacteriota bacterium]